MEQPCSAERMGQHEEQLKQLKDGQVILHESIHADMVELKTDMKELICTFQKYMEANQNSMSEKIDKLQETVNTIAVDKAKLEVKVEDLSKSMDSVKSVGSGVVKVITWSSLATLIGYVLKHTFGG